MVGSEGDTSMPGGRESRRSSLSRRKTEAPPDGDHVEEICFVAIGLAFRYFESDCGKNKTNGLSLPYFYF